MIVAAIATFKLSLRPRCGMVTHVSAPKDSSRPRASLPIARHTLPDRSASSRATVRPSSCDDVPTTEYPASRTSLNEASSTTATWNTAPADARTTFGFVGSTLPVLNSTPDAPNASADRKMVPRFPGSLTASHHTTQSFAAGVHGRSVRLTIASAGWGDCVSATRSRTPRCNPNTCASVPGNEMPRSLVKISSTSQPAAIASAIRVGPSTTKKPSSKRALRRPMRRRSR